MAFSQSYRIVGRSASPQYWSGSSKPVSNVIPVQSDFLRLIGYYLSNGSCDTAKGRLRISFDAAKKRLEIEDTKRLLERIFHTQVHIEKTPGCETLLVTSVLVAKFFAALCGVGAHHKNLPLWLMTLPPSKQRHILIGIFRGDGHLSINRLILRMVNEGLIRQVFILLRRCGFLPTLEHGKKSTSKLPQGKTFESMRYTVSVSPQDAHSLTCDIFPTNSRLANAIKGKRSSIEIHGYLLRPVKSITQRPYIGEVYNMEVDEDSSYSVQGVAAHNCWFNIGVPNVPQQASACFLIDVEDTMESIINWYKDESIIFKGGSGSGLNVSKIRGKDEGLSGGGKSSGVLSFMKAADASAGVIQSGGRVRRAAKMVILDADHPELLDFIWCKALEERKARALIAAGYDDAIDGEAYRTVAFQNANHSVSVTDEFMRKALAYEVWCTKNRTSYEGREHKAEDLLTQMATACWESGDPGVMFADTVNAWHTCPHDGKIISPNPCSEYFFLPYTACNLASMNLLKFLRTDGSFDTDAFQHVVDILVTAQDILVGRADYPTPVIQSNSHTFRTIGIGYNNLGGLLMAKGLPYDSDEGRNYAATITALMTGRAYRRSAELAILLGAFPGYHENATPMMDVILKHADALSYLEKTPLCAAACEAWSDAYVLGNDYGYRNAQVSLLQPGGTVSYMMDCITTGIEPDVALVSAKKLVGGGTLTKVNPLITHAMRSLGYHNDLILMAHAYVKEHGTLEGCHAIRPSDLPVFDCAFPAVPDGRSIAWQGHIQMVAAVQPFLSGGVSKTINMPSTSTVEDIEHAFIMAWQLGCKSIAIYRDGCKHTQVLTTGKQSTSISDTLLPETHLHTTLDTTAKDTAHDHSPLPQRKRLPDERPAVTHKASVGGQEFYLTVGLHEDQTPGELMIKIAKQGSTLAGITDSFAIMVSLALQYGVPLAHIIEKFEHTRFEPLGFTTNPAIPQASSIMDYIAKWLRLKFMDDAPQNGHQSIRRETMPQPLSHAASLSYDAPPCMECGAMMVRTGACYSCRNCGANGGCG
jgi:ribonucleoside-diphosphate reductase alpha chain